MLGGHRYRIVRAIGRDLGPAAEATRQTALLLPDPHLR